MKTNECKYQIGLAVDWEAVTAMPVFLIPFEWKM